MSHEICTVSAYKSLTLRRAVVKTLRESYPPREKQGFVIFITGLFNSGKDTIAKALQVTLNQQGGRITSLLLGATARQEIAPLPFELAKDAQAASLANIAFASAELARAGAAVIAAHLAPTNVQRATVKHSILQYGGSGGNFFHVHVARPLEHCERGDRSGIYKKARAGEIQGFPGVDSPYEEPEKADLYVDVTQQTFPEIVHSEPANILS